MGLSKYTWWYNVGAKPETTVRMPSGCRITECAGGVLLTYPDGVKRFISDNWYDEDRLKDLLHQDKPKYNPMDFSYALDPKNYRAIITADFNGHFG